ncbi:peptidylprolyl isomerase, partial [Candidatus Gracilibacteria bacterium]|nr:peptidylprolyl isomerase [Candidatus Gracilibacteria bacterium]
MKRFITWKLGAIAIVSLVLGFYNLPGTTQKAILPFLPNSVTENQIHLGLDLSGGSQLDYKIDLRKVPEADREDITNGVLEVIERRVNGLGVSEPNIFLSKIAEEQHIIVELANTGDITQSDVNNYLGSNKSLAELTSDERQMVGLEKAKATVGKTIQLEFKEEKTSLDPDEKGKIKENAQSALNRIKAGEDYGVVGQEESQAFPGKVQYETTEFIFQSEIPADLKATLEALEPGQVHKHLLEVGGTFTIDGTSGQTVEETGQTILKLLEEKEDIKYEKTVYVSHILIAHEGANQAPAEVTRSEDDALELAKEIKQKLADGGNFEELVKEFSNDPSNKNTGGELGIVNGDGSYVYDFEQGSLSLENVGDLSEPVKTKYGYHLIRADKIQSDVGEKMYRYETITYSTTPDAWQETSLTGEQFVRADVQVDSFFQPYILITFNEEGAELFEELTEKNINKRIAIFVGGDLVSAPNVQTKISGGTAQITGNFTIDEAQKLARDLNTGAIPAPIVLTGEYTIGATLGAEALSDSLNAVLIGLLLVMLFMAFYYKIAGLLADLALLVYAIIFIFLIKSTLPLMLAISIALLIFGFLIHKIINGTDSGWEKFLSFILTCIAFFFITFLLQTSVVISLAGVAGIILSIGIAVDANVLIFERFKEELASGKPYAEAVEAGFNRAWSAIRDSNFSTLITCGILFYFGSSIIRGFAFNLAAGILVSMFTAITVTRTLLQSFIGKKIAENHKAFGMKEKSTKEPFNFIKKSKIWFTFSGTLVSISLVAILLFGMNLGIDFKGGTLMQFQFNEDTTKETLIETLGKIEDEINAGNLETTNTPTESENSNEVVPAISTDVALVADSSTIVDFKKAQILESGINNYIIKSKYITSATHEQVLAKMKEQLPSFSEQRFTTIGPV